MDGVDRQLYLMSLILKIDLILKFLVSTTIKNTYFQKGYNFLPSEISAAFAIEQIKKLKTNIEKRNFNFEFLKKYFNKYNQYFKT